MQAVLWPFPAGSWARCAVVALLLAAAGPCLAGDAPAPAGIEEARRAVADGAWPRARTAIEALEQAHAAPDDPARPTVEALRAEFVARRKAFLSRFAGDRYPVILRRWVDAEVRRPRVGWDEVARRVGSDAARETFDDLLAQARRLDAAVTRDEVFDAWRERPRTDAMWQPLDYGPLGPHATAPPPPPGGRIDTGARDLAWRKASPAERLRVFLALFTRSRHLGWSCLPPMDTILA